MDIIKKKPEDWTAEDIANFWNWQSQNPTRLESYFTAENAGAIISFLRSNNMLQGKFLDYGCGSGHLLSLLSSEKNIDCYGLDFSQDSIAATGRRTKHNQNIKQIVVAENLPTVFTPDMFDTITCIETIEHLQEKILMPTLHELFRILKPGGKILFTTPFNEALEKHLTFCPFCKSEFHQMQHMQSFTTAQLSTLLQQLGFTVLYCKNIDIEKLRLGVFKYGIKKAMGFVAEVIGVKPKAIYTTPNLLAIVTKY